MTSGGSYTSYVALRDMTFSDSIGHQIATSKAKAAGFNKTHPASFQWLSRQRQHRQEFILSNLCKCILLLMDGRVLASQCTVYNVSFPVAPPIQGEVSPCTVATPRM